MEQATSPVRPQPASATWYHVRRVICQPGSCRLRWPHRKSFARWELPPSLHRTFGASRATDPTFALPIASKPAKGYVERCHRRLSEGSQRQGRMFYIDRFKSLSTYSLRFLKDDALSGLTVSLISLPLAMAFAIAIGVSPKYGLFAAIISGGIQAVFGGSESNISGPAGAFIGALTAFMGDRTHDEVLLVGMLAGTILIAASVLRIGKLVQYVPYPVILGFTGGIGVIILKTQVGPATGIDLASAFDVFSRLSEVSYQTLGITVLTIVVIRVLAKFAPKLPNSLLAVVMSALLVWLLGLDVTTVASQYGHVPRSLPGLSVPEFASADWGGLLPTALAIAALAALESLLSATASDGMTGNHHHSGAELFGCGLANLVGPLFGGIPVCGAIARTTLNAKSGSRTFLAALFNALFLLLMVLVFAPLVGQIPIAALAGVLIAISIKLINPVLYLKLLKTMPIADFLMVTSTLLLTIFASLSIGVMVGLGIAVVAFLSRYRNSGNQDNVLSSDGPSLSLDLNHSLYFGNARKIFRELTDSSSTSSLTLRLTSDTLLDATGVETLKDLKRTADKVDVIIEGVTPKVKHAFDTLGLTDVYGKEALRLTT